MKNAAVDPLRLAIGMAAAVLFANKAQAAEGSPNVSYTPQSAIVQGIGSFTQSYTLNISGPGTLPSGTTVSVPLQITVLSAPSGVTSAVALSFISASPSSLTFTSLSTKQSTTITLTFPPGNFAGSYAFGISTIGATNPWPVSAKVKDSGAAVNATVFPAVTTPPPNKPSVTIASPGNLSNFVFNAVPGTPVSIPVSILASVLPTDPTITSISGSLSGGGLSVPLVLDSLLSIVGLTSDNANGTYNFVTSLPGTYTVTASATNSAGTANASSQFTVTLTAPAPTIAASSPTPNASFTYTIGSSAGATVPVSVTGKSQYGDITSLTATLDGTAINLTTTGVNSALVANGTASLTVAAGTHSLVFLTTNAYGTATVTVPFTVVGNQPQQPPTITISSPANNSSYSFASGGSVSVPYAFKGATTSGTITAVKVTLSGPSTTITPTITGIGTAAISGSGTLTLSAAGTYTITATDTNAAGSASASTTFTVTQAQPQPEGTLYWLGALGSGQTQCGGSTVPIEFTIQAVGGQGGDDGDDWDDHDDDGGNFVTDKTLVISISEIYSNGTMSAATLYTYSQSSANPPHFTIEARDETSEYLLQFPTASGVHHYSVEVYHPLAAGGAQILGQKDFYTQTCNCGSDGGDDDGGDNGDGGDQGDDGGGGGGR